MGFLWVSLYQPSITNLVLQVSSFFIFCEPTATMYTVLDSVVDVHPLLRSLVYEVSDGRVPVAEARRQSEVEANRSLEVFIFLEETGAEGDKRSNCNEHWKHVFCLVHQLRRNFDRLVMIHSKKFHQTIHSALNKFVCNYGSHAKVSFKLFLHNIVMSHSKLIYLDWLGDGCCHPTDIRGCSKHPLAQLQ